ncbi:MAG: HAD-IIIA family hydrolase, partial [Pseudomonadota bacterium]|nr:HAD-IIIA family hydrolase [Pseudomonadota bacterium]
MALDRQTLLERAAAIRLVIFDVDGVLTDGSLFFGNDGNEYKAFNIRDGHGIKMLQANGVEVAIISGRRAVSTERRMADLGVRHVQLGVEDKLAAFTALLAGLEIGAGEVAYLGDDIIDLPVMRRVGLAVTVADADAFVKTHAHWQT